MHTESTDAAYSTDAWIVPSPSALDEIVQSTPCNGVADDRDLWLSMPAPSQQPIWPRVWPGL